MKMAAIPYTFYPHFTDIPLSSLSILCSFNDCHWLAIISEYQTKKMNNNETFLAKSRKESSIDNIWMSMYIYIKRLCQTYCNIDVYQTLHALKSWI